MFRKKNYKLLSPSASQWLPERETPPATSSSSSSSASATSSTPSRSPMPQRILRFSHQHRVIRYSKPKVPKEDLWFDQKDYAKFWADTKGQAEDWNCNHNNNSAVTWVLDTLFTETQQVRFNAIFCQPPLRGMENLCSKRLAEERDACRHAALYAVLSYQRAQRQHRTRSIERQWEDLAFLSSNHSYKAAAFAQRMGKADGVLAHHCGEDIQKADTMWSRKGGRCSTPGRHQQQQQQRPPTQPPPRRRNPHPIAITSSDKTSSSTLRRAAQQVTHCASQLLCHPGGTSTTMTPAPLTRLVSI